MQKSDTLIVNQELFQSLNRESEDMITMMDSSGNTIYVNPAVEKKFGYSYEECLRLTIMDVIHPDDIGQLQEFFTELMQSSGKLIKCPQIREIKKDGSVMWVEGTLINLLHKDSVNAIVSNFRDITARKLAEEKLQESERKYKSLFDNNPAPMMVFDFESQVIIDCNQEILSMYGYSREEFLKLRLEDVCTTWHDEEGLSARDLYENADKSKSVHRTKSGTLMHVEISSHSLDEAGRVISLVQVEDVTEAVISRELLIENEKKLNIIYDSIIDIVFMLDVEEGGNYKFAFVNKAFTEATGIPSGDVVGKYINQVIPESSLKVVERNYNESVRTGKRVTWQEVTTYPAGTKTGIVTVVPVYNSAGECTQIVGSVHDITDKKRADEELRISEEKYKLFFAVSPLPKFIFDKKTLQVIDANEAALELYGYSKADLQLMNLFDFGTENTNNNLKSALNENLQNDRVVNLGIFEQHKKNNQLIRVELTANRFDYFGQEAMIMLMNDVTIREEALEHLKESELRLLTAQKIARLGYWQIIPGSKEIFWSDEVYNIWETTKGDFEMSLENILSTIPAEFRADYMNNLDLAIAGNKEMTFEHKLITANGKMKWIQQRGEMLFDATGKPVVFEGTIQDITAQKNLSVSLEKANQRFTYATRATSDAIWDWDIQNDTHYSSDGYMTIFGRKAEEMAHGIESWIKYIHPDDLDQTMAGIMKSIHGTDISWSAQYRYLKGDGQYAYVSDKAFLLRDPEGKASRMVGAMRDVTENHLLNQQNELLDKIRQVFNREADLFNSLEMVLAAICKEGNYDLAKAWLVDSSERNIRLATTLYESQLLQAAYGSEGLNRHLLPGKGFAGKVWEEKRRLYWNLDVDNDIKGDALLKHSGIINIEGVPLFYNEEMIGALILGRKKSNNYSNEFMTPDFLIQLGAEIKRKQLEEELSQVFSTVNDVILIADFNGFFIRLNKAAIKLFEYTEEELLSTPFINFIHPDDRHKTADEVRQLTAGLELHHIENRYITKSGKIKWLSWTSTSSVTKEMIFAVGKDVTEKKNLEELLDNANRMAQIGGWEIDIINQKVYWSDIVKDIREVERDYVPDLETGISFFKDGESRDTINARVQQCRKYGTPWDEELEIRTFKGNMKWVRTIGEAEMIDGKCVRIYGSFQDIDVRKRAEIESLKVLREKNEVLESIGDAFFAVDVNWVVSYWNNRAEDMFKFTRSFMVGRNLWEVYPDAIGSVFHQHYNEAMQEQKQVNFESYYLKGDMWLEVSIYPTPAGLSVYIRDISKRKSAENNLHELNENLVKQARELEVSNRDLEQFAYVASHDLQEPLRMISGFIKLLDKKYGESLDDKGRQYIHFAVDGAMRMRQIILDLLEFSRVGRWEDKVELIDMNALIKGVLLLFSKKIEDTGALITIEKLPSIQSYRSPISQLFQNLLSNALKYSREAVPPEINISSDELPDKWIFKISDNGIGIDEEFHEKIFIIFQRLHSKEEYSGTGIGLAIVKKILDTLGGFITIEAGELHGSVFTLSIPKIPVM